MIIVKGPTVLRRFLFVMVILVLTAVTGVADSELAPIMTDQGVLNVSNRFGVAGPSVVNDAGAYAFLSSAANAVFYRTAGAPVATRVLQSGDEAPGFPGSRIDLIFQLRMNSSGLMTFKADFFQANGSGMAAIYSYDGTTLTKLVDGTQPAPGSSPAANFERAMNVVGMNDNGDVIFTAPLVKSGSPDPLRTTLYLAPAGGGTPIRVIGIGDTAAGLSPGTYTSIVVPTQGFNNSREIVFSSNLTGTTSPSGSFVYDTDGVVRKVVGNGESNSLGTWAVSTSLLLNNDGDLAFASNNAIWTRPRQGSPTIRLKTGDAAPAAIGGNVNVPSLAAFNDSADMAVVSSFSGTSNGSGILRSRVGQPLEAVAFRNQAAPGGQGNFNIFGGVTATSQNASGTISFRATVTGSAGEGLFQQGVGGSSVALVYDKTITPLGGSGIYNLAVGSGVTKTLSDGSAFFWAEIAGGTADYAEFLVSTGSSRTLMSTADLLPAGSRLTLRTFRQNGAGDYVGFTVARTGGGSNIAIHNIATRQTTILVRDGDSAPGVPGGVLRLALQNFVAVNASGTVAFASTVVGVTATGPNNLYTAGPSTPVTKIAGDGDAIPGLAGKTYSALSFGSALTNPLNSAGQIAFLSNVLSPSKRTIFVWTPGSPNPTVSRVVGVDDLLDGVAVTSLGIDYIMNSAGQVAFRPTFSGGATAIYISDSSGSTRTKIAKSGEPSPAPGAPNYSSFASPDLSDPGGDPSEVGFMAVLSSGDAAVFTSTTTTTPTATMIVKNGDTTPAGGTYSMTTARPEVLINPLHDVVFRSNISGATADSGYFMRRGSAGAIQSVLLQGQTAPGTAGPFTTVTGSANLLVHENFQLSNDGELAVQSFWNSSGVLVNGNFHFRKDNVLEPLLLKAQVNPSFGDGFAVLSVASIAWNSGGRYLNWARVSGANFRDGVFLFVPVVSTPTPIGVNPPPVIPQDSTTGGTPVTMNFSNVTGAGTTTLTTAAGGPTLPGNFALGNPPIFFDLQTTATFNGAIQVCFDITNVTFPPNTTPRLLHFENNVWVDSTTSLVGNTLCGTVTSLSPFALAVPQNPTAAGVSVAGQVTADGRGVRNARVTLTSMNGQRHTALTSSMGFYQVEELPAGGTYVASVVSGSYTFEPRTITLNDSISGLDFSGTSTKRPSKPVTNNAVERRAVIVVRDDDVINKKKKPSKTKEKSP